MLKVVLQPLFDHERNCDLNDTRLSPYFHTLYGNGNWHQCFVRIGAWLADYPEHMALQSLQANSCPWCKVPTSKFGEYPSVFSCCDHLEYKRVFYNDDSTQRVVQFTEWGVCTTTENVLWRLRCNPTELPKPDLLHTIQVGMLKHLLLWIISFLKSHHWLALFNSLWMAIPSYLSMTQPKKSFEETVQ